MSHRHYSQLKQTWYRTLLLATLPLACAVGVKPEFGDNGDDTSTTGGSAGRGSGGALPFAGSSSAGTTAKAGSAGTSGGSGSGGSVANPFGGTSSTGGQSGGGAAGTAGAAGKGGGGGAGGSGGAAGAGGGGGAAGAGTGTCACPKKTPWADNTNVSFGPGDCLVVDGKTYLYTGAKAQTWANKDCNPTMQLAWCSDMGADYKFMLCQ